MHPSIHLCSLLGANERLAPRNVNGSLGEGASDPSSQKPILIDFLKKTKKSGKKEMCDQSMSVQVLPSWVLLDSVAGTLAALHLKVCSPAGSCSLAYWESKMADCSLNRSTLVDFLFNFPRPRFLAGRVSGASFHTFMLTFRC